MPVPNNNVTKNLTGHRMHVEGTQIYQINRQIDSFHNTQHRKIASFCVHESGFPYFGRPWTPNFWHQVNFRSTPENFRVWRFKLAIWKSVSFLGTTQNTTRSWQILKRGSTSASRNSMPKIKCQKFLSRLDMRHSIGEILILVSKLKKWLVLNSGIPQWVHLFTVQSVFCIVDTGSCLEWESTFHPKLGFYCSWSFPNLGAIHTKVAVCHAQSPPNDDIRMR